MNITAQLTVFNTTVDFFTAPGYVQLRMRQYIAKYGSNLDTTAPNFVRVAAWRAGERFGTPGTAFAIL